MLLKCAKLSTDALFSTFHGGHCASRTLCNILPSDFLTVYAHHTCTSCLGVCIHVHVGTVRYISIIASVYYVVLLSTHDYLSQ